MTTQPNLGSIADLSVDLDAAARYVRTSARVLECRLLDVCVDGADAGPVIAAVAAYRNADGGFGHGVEPDKRVPDSQPLDVQMAFEALDAAGAPDRDLVSGACAFLQSLGPGVGCLTPPALEHPRAPHWAEFALPPALNPTAALAGLLWKWDVDHPWRAAATDYCWGELDRAVPGDGHTFGCVLTFLAHVADRDRVATYLPGLREAIGSMQMLRLDPDGDEYGVTPLQLAPTPDAFGRQFFDDATIEAHLAALASAQQPDGGWQISWETIGDNARQEWRGRVTLDAIRTLRAYGVETKVA